MNTKKIQSTERFTETVTNYIKYRPSYPKAVLETLITDCGFNKNSIIADVGSGTGLLAKLFLEFGNLVYCVEPNDMMRLAAEKSLVDFPQFKSIKGTAEETSLKSESVDFVTAGTAFHWFDPVLSKEEFKRILCVPGWVLLVWNVRDLSSQFAKDYENLIIEYGTDYRDSKASKFDKTVVSDFFSPFTMYMKSFPNKQIFDWDGLQGRLNSTSYAPRCNDERYKPMMQELRLMFERYQQNNHIEFPYHTKLYYGRLK